MSEKLPQIGPEKAAPKAQSKTKEDADNENEYPSGRVVAVVMLAIYLAIFLVALDRTIIATAIPRITDDFHSLGDVGWYGSAYLLTSCSFQLLFGRVYTFYSPKRVLLAAIAVFEVGSAVCGAAPGSTVFIVGRAVAGVGSAGVFSGAVILVTYILPLHKRPMYISLVGAVFGVASVVGPLMGGAFTQNVSWRWCFYINLPIGAVAAVIVALILKLPSSKAPRKSAREQLAQLDPLGTACFVPAIVCLLIALQWGGTVHAWSSWRIILLLVLFAVLLLLFLTIQVLEKDTATLPLRIITQRSVAAGFLFTFCIGAAMMVIVYFLPIWFQAIQAVTAVQSGIRVLPLILGLVVASICAGAAITKLGYYTPFMIACSMLVAIGIGLLSTLTVHSRHPAWIGYQVLIGIGLGLGMQQAGTAAQAVLAKRDIPTGVAVMFFGQQLGGAVFLSVAQNLFINHLARGLAPLSARLDPALVAATGATDLRKVVDVVDLPRVLVAYNSALVSAFQVAIVVACVSVVGAAAVEWKNIKKVRAQAGGAKV